MEYAFKSISGRRPNNEDRCRIEKKDNGLFLLVLSDGMGGHAAGEVASEITVNTICERFKETQRPATTEFLESAILTANLNVYRMAASSPKYAGMGATVVCTVIDGSMIYSANVGDSRMYLFRAGQLTQITHDHSFVQELLDIGRITENEAAVHPMRNVITRSIGAEIRIEPSCYTFGTGSGDWLLLCSDGLSGVLSEHAICDILSEETTADQKADALIASAFDAGSHDNISVCIARIGDDIV